jgi:hypothetical protein
MSVVLPQEVPVEFLETGLALDMYPHRLCRKEVGHVS